jgi:ubiquinol-cytochrome c reductase cytochrome b subunit
MNRFVEWLDHRTGIRSGMHAALFEHIPGGARWRYVWGSTLSFC